VKHHRKEIAVKTSTITMGFVTALLALSSLCVQAADTGTSSLTRAEVRAELLRARAAGELPSPSDVYGPVLAQAMAQASPETRGASHIKTAAEAPAPSRTASAAK
jgi:hypothetical protein